MIIPKGRADRDQRPDPASQAHKRFSSLATAVEGPHDKTSVTRREYRVTWRRAAWSASTGSKSRTYADRDRAERFAERLRRPWAGLSPAVVTVQQREVGPWSQGWGSQ